MNATERPRALLVSSGFRRREQLHNQLVDEGYAVVSQCQGPDGDRHCPGLSHGSCGLTIPADVVILDVASINGVAALQAFYASQGIPVQARSSPV
jgi:hypothetical protein